MSKPISITIPHELGQVEARRRIDQGFSQFAQQFGSGPMTGVEKTWQDDRLHFGIKVLGQSVTGRMEVQPAAVRMEVDLPDMLAMVANTIKGKLQKKGRLLLEKK